MQFQLESNIVDCVISETDVGWECVIDDCVVRGTFEECVDAIRTYVNKSIHATIAALEKGEWILRPRYGHFILKGSPIRITRTDTTVFVGAVNFPLPFDKDRILEFLNKSYY